MHLVVDNMNEFSRHLRDNGIKLPRAPVPAGNYRATVELGNLLFISGQLPLRDGVLIYKGQLGNELTIDEGKAAAELCALNLLSQLAKAIKQGNFRQLVKLEGFINCTASFTEHAAVLDGASDLLSGILSEKAGHTRTVAGCASLPLGAAIELSAIVQLD